MSAVNYYQYLKYDQPASFSFKEVKHLQQDLSICHDERNEFRKAFIEMKKKIEQGIPENKVIAFVKPETGLLSISAGEYLSIDGMNDEQISFDELIEMAFNAETEDELSKYYQDFIKKYKTMCEKYDEHRVLIIKNTVTNRLNIWFD